MAGELQTFLKDGSEMIATESFRRAHSTEWLSPSGGGPAKLRSCGAFVLGAKLILPAGTAGLLAGLPESLASPHHSERTFPLSQSSLILPSISLSSLDVSLLPRSFLLPRSHRFVVPSTASCLLDRSQARCRLRLKVAPVVVVVDGSTLALCAFPIICSSSSCGNE